MIQPKRKRMKVKQRARIWSHQIKEAALTAAGQGIGLALQDLPKRMVTDQDIRSWLQAADTRDAYETLRARLKELPDEKPRQSTSPGDCFALFALARAVGATKALEIGTHLGFSTLHLASALARNGTAPKLTTVDVIDVNDEVAAHYKSYGVSMSARQRLRALELEDRVEFAVSSSEAFLKRTDETYDIIFVDGDHSESGAYFDIMRSLLRLNESGIIVLHDYNDPDDLTPGVRTGLYGVYWAIHRLRSHIPDIAVVPLRSIIMPDGETQMPTSLAVVTRRPGVLGPGGGE
jgi:predicted O-methyltransferase YrrM